MANNKQKFKKNPVCEWNQCGLPCSPIGDDTVNLCYGHKQCLKKRSEKLIILKNKYINTLVKKFIEKTTKNKNKNKNKNKEYKKLYIKNRHSYKGAGVNTFQCSPRINSSFSNKMIRSCSI